MTVICHTTAPQTYDRQRAPLTCAPLASGESDIPLGGGRLYRPPTISQTTRPISKIVKIQTVALYANGLPFGSPVRELSEQGAIFDLHVNNDVTGQVTLKMFDFSGLKRMANKIRSRKIMVNSRNGMKSGCA